MTTPLPSEAFRRTVYDVAQAIAPGWGRQRARIEKSVAPVREWMINELGPQPGDTVLELAAGAGDTGFVAARSVGKSGRLISTDFSPEMMEVARRRGVELRLESVDYRVVDAEHIELDADAVDGVLCRFGYMLMARPAVALAETRRVLRSGGRLALSVWGAPEGNPWATILAGTLVEGGYVPPPQPGEPNPFSLADVSRTSALIESAGFGTVRSVEVAVRFSFADLDDYLDFVSDTAGPLALVVRGLSDGERESFVAQLRERLDPFVVGGGYELPGVALCAVAS